MAELLKDLIDTLRLVQGRAENHKEYFSEGHRAEWRTRIGLIDPLLTALGWDVADPNVVQIEPKVAASTPSGEGWADYALLDGHTDSKGKPAGRPVLIIEAKNLSIKKAPLPQTVSYVVNENMQKDSKIPYCAWTNGNEWAVYDVSSQTLKMQATIVGGDEDLPKLALKFIGLWRDSLGDREYKPSIEPFILEKDDVPSDSKESDGTTGQPDTQNGTTASKREKGSHLSEDEVRKIRALKKAGHTYRSIMEELEISQGAVYAVLSGRAHKNVV